MGDHPFGEIAQLAEMGEIVPAQRSHGRLAEQESPDLWRGESLPRKYGADKLSDLDVVVVINLNQSEPRQKPVLGQVPSFEPGIQNGSQFAEVELF